MTDVRTITTAGRLRASRISSLKRSAFGTNHMTHGLRPWAVIVWSRTFGPRLVRKSGA